MGRGVAIVGGAALNHVGDEHVLASHADCRQHFVEQLPRPSDEREALLVFVVAGSLADEHQPRRAGAVPRNGHGPFRAERAEDASIDAPLQLFKVCREDVVGHVEPPAAW